MKTTKYTSGLFKKDEKLGTQPGQTAVPCANINTQCTALRELCKELIPSQLSSKVC